MLFQPYVRWNQTRPAFFEPGAGFPHAFPATIRELKLMSSVMNGRKKIDGLHETALPSMGAERYIRFPAIFSTIYPKR
jgi:hypothetical protein